MKYLNKAAIVVIMAVLVVGCASTSDVENLQTQVDVLKVRVDAVAADAAAAKASAQAASEKAGMAMVASNHAADSAKAIDEKLDRFFKKTQYK